MSNGQSPGDSVPAQRAPTLTQVQFDAFQRWSGTDGRRRIARALATLVPLVAGLGVVVPAQTVLGNGIASARCGSPQSASPASGDHVTLESSGVCLAPRVGGLASVNDAKATNAVEAGRWLAQSFSRSDFYGTPDDAGDANARWDITFQANDLIFTNVANPGGGGFVPASTNFYFRGSIETRGLSNCSGSLPSSQSYFSFEPPVGPAVSGNLLRQRANPLLQEGLFAGYPNDASWVAYTTPTASTDLDLPRLLTVRVFQQATVAYCDIPPADLGVAKGMVEVSLPCGTPVFNLPPGYTVNSAQLGIVDNIRTNCSLDPTLRVTKDASDNVHLEWVGGSAPFTLRRAEDPAFTVIPTVLLDEQFATDFDDAVLGDGKTYFYLVD